MAPDLRPMVPIGTGPRPSGPDGDQDLGQEGAAPPWRLESTTSSPSPGTQLYIWPCLFCICIRILLLTVHHGKVLTCIPLGGPHGPKGPNGTTWAQWVPGPTGPNGPNGSRAQLGPMGPMGPGPNWAQWAEWVPGLTGPNGSRAQLGPMGPMGPGPN